MTAHRQLRLLLTLTATGLLLLASPALAAFGLDFTAPDQGSVTELGILESFHTTLTNTGDQDDVYTVTMVKNIPSDWVGSLCVGETCFPPFVTTIEVPLSAGNTEYLDIDITPNVVTGFGSLNITVASQGDPGIRPVKDFTVVSTGLEVLVVTDDTTPGLTPYLTAVMDGTTKTYGVWKRIEMGSLTDLELGNFATVVWSAGELTGGLVEADRTALAYFVQHGGNLFLSGRDLAYEACDTGSPFYTPSSKSWFNTILGTDYNGQPGPLMASALGLDGDPVTGGLYFDLTGGDGADNTAFTLDGLMPVGAGLTGLRYHDLLNPSDAAIRSTYGDGKTFFCGFAFEAISTAAGRALLLGRVLDWFDGLLVAVPEDLQQPLLTRAPYAAPNPFNPQTSIKFEVGGERQVTAEITIHDLRGQVVRRLFAGQVAPGLQDFVWNGKLDDGRHAATGVYLARVLIDGTVTEPVKMTLVK